MKQTLLAGVVALAAIGAAPAAQAGVDVGVSINIGEPGFFGQIDLGNAPPPALIYPQPVVYGAVVVGPPLYLRVPAGYESHWGRYCARYNACGRRVYFVRDDWYRNTYAPYYHDHYYEGRWHDERRGPEYRGDDHRDRGHDDHGRGRDDHDDRGRGHDDHDRGHDRGDRDHDHDR